MDAREGRAERSGRLPFLCLAALGIVFGDIGTSPLYALRECFHGPGAVSIAPGNVLGVLSLILWSLLLVISLKYMIYVLRADNQGEGGILALMSLLRADSGPKREAVLSMGLFGAALLYGDGALTPAISVLSAVEGIGIATPVLAGWAAPATIVILALLFLLQKKGTSGIGAVFGPVMVVWFLVLAGLGVRGILLEPGVLGAADPRYAVRFFIDNGARGFTVLGAVFLVVTGGEALYADLGHFTRRPIILAWFLIAGPSLVLNYFGQGALLLRDPAAAQNPFYRLAPPSLLYPLVALATAATVIASQAVITGVFSLTRQAVRLGYLPRMTVVHTSARERGQIYVPTANWMLLAASIGLVLSFGSSSRLAGAYGIAVSVTMVITTLLACGVAIQRWGWPRPVAFILTGAILVVDMAFASANALKFFQGGWVPIAIAGAVTALFTTWKKGRLALSQAHAAESLPIRRFVGEVSGSSVVRVPGQAVYPVGNPEGTPAAMLHNIKHNKVLHKKNFLVTVETEETPRVAEERRLAVEPLGEGFTLLRARFGFMESPDLLAVLYRANELGLGIDPLMASYLLSRNIIVHGQYGGMPAWRRRLFRLLYQNALRPALYFRLPPNRVIEIGRQVQL